LTLSDEGPPAVPLSRPQSSVELADATIKGKGKMPINYGRIAGIVFNSLLPSAVSRPIRLPSFGISSFLSSQDLKSRPLPAREERRGLVVADDSLRGRGPMDRAAEAGGDRAKMAGV
jgi:hypothetical protein